jgi:mRNA interferase RelE/StbE
VSESRYTVTFDPAAARAIQKLQPKLRARIIAKAEALAINPRPSGCVKLSGSENLYRIRVGDWRIVYQIRDNGRLVIILIVGHRREVYRDL